jgi:hypothetical protein
MFWHEGAIFREFLKNKRLYVQHGSAPGVWLTMLQAAKHGASSLPLLPLTKPPHQKILLTQSAESGVPSTLSPPTHTAIQTSAGPCMASGRCQTSAGPGLTFILFFFLISVGLYKCVQFSVGEEIQLFE